MTSSAAILNLVDERTSMLLERREAGLTRRRALILRSLLGADFLGLAMAFSVSEYVFVHRGAHGQVNEIGEWLIFAFSLPVWLGLAKIYGLYDRDQERADHSTAEDLVGVFHLVTVAVWALSLTTYATGVASPSPPKLMSFWALAIVLVAGGRVLARAVCRRHVGYLQNTVIVGAGRVGQMIARKLLDHPEYGLNVVGFVDPSPTERSQGLEHLAMLGKPADLPRLINLLDVERVVFAFSRLDDGELLTMIRESLGAGAQVDIVPRLFDGFGPRSDVHLVEGVPLIGLAPSRRSRAAAVAKRAIDLTLSLSGLFILAPLLALIALLVKLDSEGPVFYRHERVGLDNTRFRVFKFRTMHLESCVGDEYGGISARDEFERLMGDPTIKREFEASHKIQQDPRVTKIGAPLRKSSLDELPQLINVVLGDMSLVGPRPVTSDELARYGNDWPEVLSVRPGITGYWQVNGRSGLRYEDRVRLDLAYVRAWSVGLDLRILARTVRVLASRSGAF